MCLLVVPAYAETTRIMPMGGAKTAGQSGFASYRYDLWFMLSEAGYEVDFVGLQQGAVHLPNPLEYPQFTSTFDGDHEGYFDGTTGAIASNANSAVASEIPEVLLLMAGSADVYFEGAAGIETAAGNLALIIEIARSAHPEVTVLLGQVPPNRLARNTLVPSLNARIAELAAQRTTVVSPVLVVDHHTGFDADTMMDATGYVPNRAGETHIASRWFAALQSVLPEPSGGPSFLINAGLNDAWYNPDTPGQGFFFNVFPNLGLMFIAWFTYETERPAEGATATLGEPGHRWVTGIGPFDGDTANITLELTLGGVFDTGEPPVTQTQGYGTLDLSFEDCANATATYSIPAAGVSGAIPVQRIVSDNVPLCESLSGQAAR